MLNKRELKQGLQDRVDRKRVTKTQANRLYIEEMNGKLEHIYKGDLPFPESTRGISGDVLAVKGQVLYLYSQQW